MTPDELARQIVGSVNAAILLDKLDHWWDDCGSPQYRSDPIEDQQKEKCRAEVQYWLDYAKGNA